MTIKLIPHVLVTKRFCDLSFGDFFLFTDAEGKQQLGLRLEADSMIHMGVRKKLSNIRAAMDVEIPESVEINVSV